MPEEKPHWPLGHPRPSRRDCPWCTPRAMDRLKAFIEVRDGLVTGSLGRSTDEAPAGEGR